MNQAPCAAGRAAVQGVDALKYPALQVAPWLSACKVWASADPGGEGGQTAEAAGQSGVMNGVGCPSSSMLCPDCCPEAQLRATADCNFSF